MRDADTCPFLVPVVADQLWMYPLGAYCRRPDSRVRVPAGATLARLCVTPSHVECSGYRACAVSRSSSGTAAGARR